MNFNIANLGSLPADYMTALESNFGNANPGKLDDEHFARTLRNENRRAEQADVEAKDRHAAERNDGREDLERAEQPKHDRSEKAVEAQSSDSRQRHADENSGDDSHDDSGQQRQADRNSDSRSEADQSEQRADADTTARDADRRTDADADDGAVQTARADGTAAAENQNHQEASGLPATASTGQQLANTAGINQPKAPETLINQNNQAAPTPVPGSQAALPGNPDSLANGALPVPLVKKLDPANLQSEDAGAGDGDGLKLAQQARALAKQQESPHLRGGQVKHGGDILPDALPRPQTARTTAGITSGQQVSNPTPDPAIPAVKVAGIIGSNDGAAMQKLQTAAAPDRAGQAELPVLTARADGNPTPTPPSPQALASLGVDGDSKSSMAGLGEDAGKSSGNSANSASAASGTSSASKAASLVQQTATSDIRSPGIQVAMHLSKAVQNGIDRLSIRLDPAELGRVDVKLEIGHDGRAIALVAAERPETLELLQRDARALERALQQAGLETDAGSLSFSLSQGDQQGGALADGSENGADSGKGDGSGQADDETSADAGDVLPQVVSNRALDISV